MTHHAKKRLHAPTLMRLAATAIGVFVVSYLVLSNASGTRAAVAPEAHFTDSSPSGLAVVPASGGSEISYTISYTGTYESTYSPSCVLNSSEYTSAPGRSITLTWYAVNYYPSTATINPGAMNVDASGSRVVNPMVTTTYVLTMTGARAAPISCSVTVSVAPASCANGLNISSYPSCVCPVGQTQSGTTCVSASCPNGLNISLYPSCNCPVGQTQSGSVCVSGDGTPPVGDPGGNSCVSNVGSVCQSGANSCGMRGSGTIQCSGACAASVPSNALCSVACWDGSMPGVGGSCPPCPSGYADDGAGHCIPPSGPQFVGFPTAQGFNASGHLEVRPSLVRSGDTTRVYWNVSNVKDCTVRGSNGDGPWTTLASGASGHVTSGISSRTDYTLFCHSLTGATPSTITETRTVNVLPAWFEPSGSTITP